MKRSLSSGWISSARYYLGGLYRLFESRQVLLCSQAVAFKVLITWVPIAILLTGFVGKILSRDRPYGIISDFVTSYFPTYQSDRLIEFVDQLQNVSGTLTLIGAVFLLIAAVSLFSTLRVVLANVFQEEWHDRRSILEGYNFDLHMVIQVGALFALVVAATVAVQTMDETGVKILKALGLQYEWLLSGWVQAARYVGLAVPLILTIGMYFQLYFFVPIPHPPARSVFAGATTAAILWEIGKIAFTKYATGQSRFENWLVAVSSDRVAMLGDTFGLVVAFVLWAYYTGLVLMLGALVVLLYERRHRVKKSNQTDP